MVYVTNPDGTYTHYFRVRNMRLPLEPNVTTPPGRQVYDWRTQ